MESHDSSQPWKMVYVGNLIAIEKHEKKGFERAVRPPGVRLILRNALGKILITREFRTEQGAHDYRLPGGKVFDTLGPYLDVRGDQNRLNQAVERAARLEAKQETGVDDIHHLTIHSRSGAGASVEWDLYYLTGTIGAISEQQLEEDEQERGIEVGFYSDAEVLDMLTSGAIAEDRSAAVLFRLLSA